MFRLRSALAIATLVTGAAVAFAAPALAQDGGSGGSIGQSSGNSADFGSVQQGAGSTAAPTAPGKSAAADAGAECSGGEGSPCAKGSDEKAGDDQVSDVPSGSADAGGGSAAGAPVALVTAGGLTLIGAGGAGAYAMSRRGRARHTV